MIAMWLDAAEGGDASAQYQLGWCYEHGQGVVRDLGPACQWYLRAARQGHPHAQYLYGLACSNGAPGVPWNRIEACKWLTLAAQAGLVEAVRALEAFRLSSEEMAEGVLRAKRFNPTAEPQTHPVSRPVEGEAPPTARPTAFQLDLPI